jgi:hypothetical protein
VKVLFLDIDGVLNHTALFEAFQKAGLSPHCDEMIDPVCVRRLNRIIAETGAKVCISSTWRIGRTPAGMQQLLQRYGFVGEVIGCTPYFFDSRCRGREIKSWILEQTETVDSVVILDDSDDMDPLMDKLVRTRLAVGLTDGAATRAIGLLNGTVAEMRR